MVTWYVEGGIVVGDVARERVEVASSSFVRHERVVVASSSFVQHERWWWWHRRW